jgi:Protein of unknown function (DUF4065)
MSSAQSLADPSRLHFEFPLPDRDDRFKEMVLYVSQQCVDDPTFSRVKLLKILFFSDFESFGKYGTPITGMPYKKLPHGPCPAEYQRIESEMRVARQIAIHSRRVYEHSSQRVFPLQEPTFSFLSGRDIAIVSGWIRFFWNKKAKEVSEYSHGKAWKIVADMEPIPYEAVFISDEPVTFEDAARARELARRYGWQF